MSKYTFYGCPDDTMRPLGIETVPVPVRSDRKDEVFGGEKVRIDLLLRELEIFLEEYPDLSDLYAGTTSALALLAGVEAGSEGDAEATVRLMEKGLEANPASLLLRSNYAMALDLQGRGEEALAQYEKVLADPAGPGNPMVRMQAARLYAERERYLEAYNLLQPLEHDLPAGSDFSEFLMRVKKMAGLEDEGINAGEKKSTPPKTFCTACGNPLAEGLAFCNKCGKPVGETRPRRASCTACGNPLAEGLAFCNKCGKRV